MTPAQQDLPRNATSLPDPATPLRSMALTPTYLLRTPTVCDVGSQPLTIYGDLSTLASEDAVLQFRQDFTATSAGSTYAIFMLSTSGVTLDENHTLVLNWEACGTGSEFGYTLNTHLTVSIEYQGATWVPIHEVDSDSRSIARTYGWQEYEIPQPHSDYVIGDEIQVKFELSHQLSQPRTWTQRLYLYWFLLEIRKDVSLNQINASSIALHSPGFTATGNAADLYAEDAVTYYVERPADPGGETSRVQFTVTYDLGYYGIDTLLGLRFTHYDWFHTTGAITTTYQGKISVIGASTNMSLCYIRDSVADPTTPDVQHATSLISGDWVVNQSISFLYDISYSVTGPAILYAHVDWASLEIVRYPDPVIVPTLLNATIYASQSFWLNVSCLDGRAPITEIRLGPWDELVGTAEGNYLHSRFMGSVGTFALNLTLRDADGNTFTALVGNLTVLHRPISIALFLSEDPYYQEVQLYLTMRDILSNNPLALYPFSKTILKNGSWFRQQDHQTDPSGNFYIQEPVIDYLRWNYTAIIDTIETSVYAATSVRASIILSDCTPFPSIDDLTYGLPLKASDQMILDYSVQCQAPLDELWLCRNHSLYWSLPIDLGTHNFTFQDEAGIWEYYLYANAQGYEGYSSQIYTNISHLDTTLVLDSSLDMGSHSIVLDIDLVDELNRSCPNVPLTLTIYDFGEVFYQENVITGLSGVMLIIHFDQYLDHAFSIQIVSESTSLYEGAILTAGNLSYDGYPLYAVIGIGVAVGVVSVVLSLIKRRLRP